MELQEENGKVKKEKTERPRTDLTKV